MAEDGGIMNVMRLNITNVDFFSVSWTRANNFFYCPKLTLRILCMYSMFLFNSHLMLYSCTFLGVLLCYLWKHRAGETVLRLERRGYGYSRFY